LFKASPDKQFTRRYLKNTQHKKSTGRVAQVVENLLSKGEALASNPSTTKKKTLKDEQF
jgi:hypothetical protein